MGEEREGLDRGLEQAERHGHHQIAGDGIGHGSGHRDVHDVVAGGLLQRRLAILLHGSDDRIGGIVDLLTQQFKTPFDVGHVLASLLTMLRERLLDLGAASMLLKLLQHIDELLLHLQRRAKLEVEDLFRSV